MKVNPYPKCHKNAHTTDTNKLLAFHNLIILWRIQKYVTHYVQFSRRLS